MQKSKKKQYTSEHKQLFMAIFQGSADVNDQGKVVVGEKEWDWTDTDVQYFVRRARQMKVEMTKLVEKEITSIFGKL